MTCMRTMSIVSIQSIVVIQNHLKSEQMERGTHDLPFTNFLPPFAYKKIYISNKKSPIQTYKRFLTVNNVF